jgi:hypothetical protein
MIGAAGTQRNRFDLANVDRTKTALTTGEAHENRLAAKLLSRFSFRPYLYRARNLVKRFFNKIKYRR